ncbi:MAG TPA: hypothetical protein VIA62_09875 [Thermoanaerobaculia bacterium]|jgi:hypothetical protein|nr:hypothetical protein [Thermoanaerobaculia bacterium]
MDTAKLRQIFEKLDQALEHPTELLIRGGAAVLAHGLEQRVTLDIDVLPASFKADPVVQDNLRYVVEDLL